MKCKWDKHDNVETEIAPRTVQKAYHFHRYVIYVHGVEWPEYVLACLVKSVMPTAKQSERQQEKHFLN